MNLKIVPNDRRLIDLKIGFVFLYLILVHAIVVAVVVAAVVVQDVVVVEHSSRQQSHNHFYASFCIDRVHLETFLEIDLQFQLDFGQLKRKSTKK